MTVTSKLQRITLKEPEYVTNTTDIHAVDYSGFPVFTIFGGSIVTYTTDLAGVRVPGSPYGSPPVFIYGFGIPLPVLSAEYPASSIPIPTEVAAPAITGVYGGNPIIRVLTPTLFIESFYAIAAGVAGWIYEGSYPLAASVTIQSIGIASLSATVNVKEEGRFPLRAEVTIHSTGIYSVKGSAFMGDMRTYPLKAGVGAFAYPRVGVMKASVSISPQAIYSLSATAKIFDGGVYPLQAGTTIATRPTYAIGATVSFAESKQASIQATVAIATQVASQYTSVKGTAIIVDPIQTYSLKATVVLLEADEDFNEQVTGNRVRYKKALLDSTFDSIYARDN